MIHIDEHDHKYFESLDEAKEEGYTPIKCTSVLEFYTLRGKTSKLLKANLEPIKDLYYALYDPNVKKYYIKYFNLYPVEVLYFYRRTLDFSGDDPTVANLRRYTDDGNVWLLLTAEQIKATTALLERLYKAQFGREGKLDYRIYVQLLRESLDYEDYMDFGKSLVGYKTVCSQYEKRIAELWKKAKLKTTAK